MPKPRSICCATRRAAWSERWRSCAPTSNGFARKARRHLARSCRNRKLGELDDPSSIGDVDRLPVSSNATSRRRCRSRELYVAGGRGPPRPSRNVPKRLLSSEDVARWKTASAPSSTVLCARNPASLTIFVHGCGVNGVGCDTLLWSTTARSSVSIARASLLCPYACLPSYSRVNITSSKSMGTCRIDATLTIRDGALPRSVGSSRCVNRNGATYLTANRSSWPSRLISLRPPAGRNQKPHC